jgi:hypothetical protein
MLQACSDGVICSLGPSAIVASIEVSRTLNLQEVSLFRALFPHWKMWRGFANAVSCEDTREPATFFPFSFVGYLSQF